MKPLNNAERKAYRLKFLSIYALGVVLIIVMLSGFLQPATAIKTVMVERKNPAKVVTKVVYITQKSTKEINLNERDSLKAVIGLNQKKMDELKAYSDSQRNIITELQGPSQSSKANNPFINPIPNAEVAKLNKQIKFLDWALRSQVAVTNTLTRENNNLKAKIDQLNNKR